MYQRLISLMTAPADNCAGLDTDACAFVTAASITDATQKSAVNQLVLDLKSASIWTKMTAIYPFVGGSASAHKYNLKDPRDLDAAFRIVWTGTVTHDANGITPDGSTGYGDTKLVPDTALSQFSTHLSLYSRTSASLAAFDFGSFSNSAAKRIYITPRRGGFVISCANSDSLFSGPGTIGIANADGKGFYTGTRRANNDHEVYKNGVSQGTVTGTETGALPSGSIYIGALNDYLNAGVTGFAARNYSFASIGSSLTDTEVADFYTAVQDYQTTLGRDV